MHINIALCDDEIIFSRELKKQLEQLDFQNNHIAIDVFTSSKELINAIKKGINYHIIFMDVDLKDNYLGTDTGMVIKMILPNTLIIYVSSYDVYYTDIVNAEPFQFLHKPVNEVLLSHTVTKALQRINYMYSSYMYTYKYSGLTNIVNLHDVMFFESKHRIVEIHMKNNTVSSFYSKLDIVEEEINDICNLFLRINKSYLLNQLFVKNYGTEEIILENGFSINVSPRYYKKMLNKIIFK